MDDINIEFSDDDDDMSSPCFKDMLREDSSVNTNLSNSKAMGKSSTAPHSKSKSGKQKKDVFVWKDALVYLLIERWQEEPVLFNVRDPSYHDKVKRANAVERIIMAMRENEHTPLPSSEQVLEKMNSLRCYYNTQRNKVKASQTTGSGTDSVYKPRWQFYDSFSFLSDMVEPRRTFSSIAVDNDESSNPESIPDFVMSAGKKKAKKPGVMEQSMLAASQALMEISEKRKEERNKPIPVETPLVKSIDDLFGDTVGKIIAEIPDGIQKDMLKLEVQKLIYQTKHNIMSGQHGSIFNQNLSSPPNQHQHQPNILLTPRAPLTNFANQGGSSGYMSNNLHGSPISSPVYRVPSSQYGDDQS